MQTQLNKTLTEIHLERLNFSSLVAKITTGAGIGGDARSAHLITQSSMIIHVAAAAKRWDDTFVGLLVVSLLRLQIFLENI